jgi:hypothetical protein
MGISPPVSLTVSPLAPVGRGRDLFHHVADGEARSHDPKLVARELDHCSLCSASSGFGHGSVLHLGFAQAS